MSDPVKNRNGLLIGLSIAFSVLTLTTIAFGAATIVLQAGAGASASAASPTPTPTAAAGPEVVELDGFEVSSVSDLSAERFALAVPAYSESTNVYALLTNEDGAQAADAYFDVTTYREDGSIVDRGLDIVYVPPGETSVLDVELPGDLSDVVSIVIEQTGIDWLAPSVSGGAAVVSVESTGLDDVLEVQLTSTITQPVERTDVYLFGYVDDEIVGVCSLWEDIPESGAPFGGFCDWAPAAIDDPITADALPEGIEFEAHVRFDGSALE